LLAVIVALVAICTSLTAASPVMAAATELPKGFGDIAVDHANRHVFVSSNMADVVTVLDYDGRVVTTIRNLAGAGSLLVDGSTVYVVLTTAGTVDAYDTKTFVRTGRYGAGALVQPGPLAMAGGKLWTSTGNCERWEKKLASIDPVTGAVQVHDVPLMLSYCIGLADAPNDTDQLLAFDAGLSPASTFRFDVSDGTPVLQVERRQENLGNLRQLAVTPDGNRFVAASGYPHEIDQFRMSDQTMDGIVYPTGTAPNAVAVTAGRGGLVAAGLDGVANSTDIAVFALGKPGRRLFTHDFGAPNDTLYSGGLAFSPDGRRLFAVSGDSYEWTARLNVFKLFPSVTTLSASAGTSLAGQPVTFTVEVTVTTDPLPTGTVTFADASGVLGSRPVQLGGASLTLTGLSAGVHDVTATYSGDDMFVGSTSTPVRHVVGTGAPPTTSTTIIPAPRPAPPGADPADGDATPDLDLTTATAGTGGYWLLSAGGDVYPFGDAGKYGSEPMDAADIEPTPTQGGYWMLGRAGDVHAKGDAADLGDAKLRPGEKAVSLSATPSGHGYWVFTDKGRVVSFGDAPHRGDMAGLPLNGGVLGSVATPSGQGYWMVAVDGGIFAFGDAKFFGSMGGHYLNRPVMSMAPDPDGVGYWLVASDGGIFAFDAPFYGSTGSIRLNQPVSGMVPGDAGYLMVAKDGGIFTFGDVPFHGSLGASPPAQPIVAVSLSRSG
jgi:hypothetical protein